MNVLARSIQEAGKAIAEGLLWLGAGSHAHTERDGSGPAQWLCRAIAKAGEAIAAGNIEAAEIRAKATREAGKTIAAAILAGFHGDELLGAGSPILEGSKAIAEAIREHADATLDAGGM
jgi:hypothetical protein